MEKVIPLTVAYIFGFISGKNGSSFWIVAVFVGSYVVFNYIIKFFSSKWKMKLW